MVVLFTIEANADISVLDLSGPSNQDRTAIDHKYLPCGESFLHQKHIGLGDIMGFAHASHRQTFAEAAVELLAFCCTHAMPEIRANYSRRYGVNTNWR